MRCAIHAAATEAFNVAQKKNGGVDTFPSNVILNVRRAHTVSTESASSVVFIVNQQRLLEDGEDSVSTTYASPTMTPEFAKTVSAAINDVSIDAAIVSAASDHDQRHAASSTCAAVLHKAARTGGNDAKRGAKAQPGLEGGISVSSVVAKPQCAKGAMGESCAYMCPANWRHMGNMNDPHMMPKIHTLLAILGKGDDDNHGGVFNGNLFHSFSATTTGPVRAGDDDGEHGPNTYSEFDVHHHEYGATFEGAGADEVAHSPSGVISSCTVMCRAAVNIAKHKCSEWVASKNAASKNDEAMIEWVERLHAECTDAIDVEIPAHCGAETSTHEACAAREAKGEKKYSTRAEIARSGENSTQGRKGDEPAKGCEPCGTVLHYHQHDIAGKGRNSKWVFQRKRGANRTRDEARDAEVRRIREHRRKASRRASFAAALGQMSTSSPEDELLAAAEHLSPETMRQLARNAGHDVSTLGGGSESNQHKDDSSETLDDDDGEDSNIEAMFPTCSAAADFMKNGCSMSCAVDVDAAMHACIQWVDARGTAGESMSKKSCLAAETTAKKSCVGMSKSRNGGASSSHLSEIDRCVVPVMSGFRNLGLGAAPGGRKDLAGGAPTAANVVKTKSATLQQSEVDEEADSTAMDHRVASQDSAALPSNQESGVPLHILNTANVIRAKQFTSTPHRFSLGDISFVTVVGGVVVAALAAAAMFAILRIHRKRSRGDSTSDTMPLLQPRHLRRPDGYGAVVRE